MIYVPIVLFAIAAAGGLTLVIMKLSGKGLPWPIVIGHGIFAASGLIALIINVFQNTQNFLMNLALVLFLIVAIGGFIVLSFHLRKKKTTQQSDPRSRYGCCHFIYFANYCCIDVTRKKRSASI